VRAGAQVADLRPGLPYRPDIVGALWLRAVRIALLLFLASLGVRLCFWLATPDRALPFQLAYQGDAPRWQQLAAPVAEHSNDYEAVLPWRPPAMTWLVRALGEGTPKVDTPQPVPAPRTRGLLVVLGSTLAPLLWLLLRRQLPAPTAALAAWITALAHPLVVLGSGVHSEVPYLFVFTVSLFAWAPMWARFAPAAALVFGALQGLDCLFRADHVLTAALLLVALLVARGAPWRRRNAIVAALAGALALLPWHLHARAIVDDYDTLHAPALPLPGALPWDGPALAAVRALPAFAQEATFRVVDATVRVRGGSRVGAADLAVLDEAYECRPEPIAPPLVAIYGPLNFFLANTPEADGGFARRALDRRPPLHGGPSRYPPGLVDGLPALALDYPPHLQALNHGYALGLRELAADPLGAAARCWRKLVFGWQGAAATFGSAALPLGTAGERRSVDLTTPTGVAASAWRLLLLALAAAGAWRLRRERALLPWAVWLLAKALTLLLFFGYARLGALTIPALAPAWAAAILALCARLPAAWPRRLAWAALAVLAVAELLRVAAPPAQTVNGALLAIDAPIHHETAVVSY
jgi:hypothetical protein